jgi:hypothetical protein
MSADTLDDALAHELGNQPRSLSPDLVPWAKRVARLSQRLRAQRDREGLTSPMRKAAR